MRCVRMGRPLRASHYSVHRQKGPRATARASAGARRVCGFECRAAQRCVNYATPRASTLQRGEVARKPQTSRVDDGALPRATRGAVRGWTVTTRTRNTTEVRGAERLTIDFAGAATKTLHSLDRRARVTLTCAAFGPYSNGARSLRPGRGARSNRTRRARRIANCLSLHIRACYCRNTDSGLSTTGSHSLKAPEFCNRASARTDVGPIRRVCDALAAERIGEHCLGPVLFKAPRTYSDENVE